MRVRVDEKRFGETVVLRGVSFEIAAGETLALVGRSGVGKTTLLRILAGLDRSFAGDVTGAGRIGLVFQSPTLLPWRSARDNVAIPNRIDAAAAEAALEEVGLARRGDAWPGALSLGQQRRVALARGFAADPDLLLLDEPFVSLDPESAERMQALTQAMLERRGARAVLVTHDLAEAALMADRALALVGPPGRVAREHRFALPRTERDADWARGEAAALRASMQVEA